MIISANYKHTWAAAVIYYPNSCQSRGFSFLRCFSTPVTLIRKSKCILKCYTVLSLESLKLCKFVSRSDLVLHADHFLGHFGCQTSPIARTFERIWRDFWGHAGNFLSRSQAWILFSIMQGQGWLRALFGTQFPPPLKWVKDGFLSMSRNGSKVGSKVGFLPIFIHFCTPKPYCFTHFWTHFRPLTKTHPKPTWSGNELFSKKGPWGSPDPA